VLQAGGDTEPDDKLNPLHNRIVRSIILIATTRAQSLQALHEKASAVLEQDEQLHLARSLTCDVEIEPAGSDEVGTVTACYPPDFMRRVGKALSPNFPARARRRMIVAG
jgi:hypothetical protein